MPGPRPDTEELITCDNATCEESYPRFHEERGPGFDNGKWLGWFYLDLNRPDLHNGPLRFCGFHCLIWWLAETKTAWHGFDWDEGRGTLRAIASSQGSGRKVRPPFPPQGAA